MCHASATTSGRAETRLKRFYLQRSVSVKQFAMKGGDSRNDSRNNSITTWHFVWCFQVVRRPKEKSRFIPLQLSSRLFTSSLRTSMPQGYFVHYLYNIAYVQHALLKLIIVYFRKAQSFTLSNSSSLQDDCIDRALILQAGLLNTIASSLKTTIFF